MKKKMILLVTMCTATAIFAGCGEQLPDMTKEQEALVTEYAAGLLLKYDDSFDNGILSAKELEIAEAKEKLQFEREQKQKQLAEEYVAKSEAAKKEKEKAKEEKNKDKNKGESEQKPNTPSIIESSNVGIFLNQPDIEISYSGYMTTKTYPEDGNNIFSVDAAQGKELVVVQYKISNASSADQNVAMDSSVNKYRLVLGDGNSYGNCSTLLLDDMAMYKNTLSSGASDSVVLVFEVNEGSDMNGAVMEINNGTEKGIMNLQ